MPVRSGQETDVLDRYRLLSKHARDIVLFIHTDGRIAEANDAAVAAYGHARAALLGMTIFELRDPASEHLIPRQMLQAESVGITFETCHRRKDGTIFPVEVSSRGAQIGDEVLLLSIIRDISERKRVEEELRNSEARYRDLFENANDIIYTLDLEGRITSFNRRAELIFGYAQADVLGTSAADLIPPEHHVTMQDALRRKLAGETAPTVYEIEVLHKGGQRVPLEVSSRLIIKDGKPIGIQGTARDITERRRAEEARRANEEMLRDADRRKDEFLAMLAHELRNPLAPIRNATQVLKLIGPMDPNLGRARDMIERQVAHMARLVDDLLDVSRITRGKILLRKESVDLTALVRAAIEDHRALLEGTGQQLTVELPETPLWVMGDPTRLSQVVGNLLHNANKFTDAGGQVSVGLGVEGDQATLKVRDSGIGMGPEILDRLFEPFSQADRSLDRSRGGLGLGLALVKGLLDLHHGTVAAQSDGIGKGSQFVVRLPLVPQEVSMDPAKPVGAGRSLKVLVVEDNRDAAESLSMLLGLLGHEVRVAYSGQAGLAIAREYRPDVVLCDIGLPGGLDGYGVARALRADPEHSMSALIALSGYGQEEDQWQSRQAGFDRHLTKPVEPETLARLLNAIGT